MIVNECFIVLKRLFTQKAAIWQNIRINDPLSIKAQVLCSSYKAICIRINSTVLSSEINEEARVLSSGDVKQFYAYQQPIYANSRSRNPPSTIPLKSADGLIITDPSIKATIFNQSFSNFFNIDNEYIPNIQMPPIPLCKLSNILFPAEAIIHQMSKLTNSRTTTPESFSSHTLKTLGSSLTVPLSLLFGFHFHIILSLHHGNYLSLQHPYF